MTLAATAPAAPLLLREPATYRPHHTHLDGRIWRETNCYFDLWIEVLHLLGCDPVPSFACALSADHDGTQWTFLKPHPEDIRRLYGLEIAEDTVWRPVLDTVEAGSRRGVIYTVEVDGWWLPDTAGTSYRTTHEKTTIVPVRVDRPSRTMVYVHNAGLFSLNGDDFDGVFGLREDSMSVLLPYMEQVRYRPHLVTDDALAAITRDHVARRADGNPVQRLADGVREALEWLPHEGMDAFHPWAFAVLRQCGATAELAADFAAEIDGIFPGAGLAAAPFRNVAEQAKSVQFKMARAASGRRVDVEPPLQSMIESWQLAMESIVAAVD